MNSFFCKKLRIVPFDYDNVEEEPHDHIIMFEMFVHLDLLMTLKSQYSLLFPRNFIICLPVRLKLYSPFLVKLELIQLVRVQIHTMPNPDSKPDIGKSVKLFSIQKQKSTSFDISSR
jgi:hypothetical protein